MPVNLLTGVFVKIAYIPKYRVVNMQCAFYLYTCIYLLAYRRALTFSHIVLRRFCDTAWRVFIG